MTDKKNFSPIACNLKSKKNRFRLLRDKYLAADMPNNRTVRITAKLFNESR